MSANNIEPSKEIKSSSQPSRQNILIAAIVASFILYLLVASFGVFVDRLDFEWAFIVGIEYWVTTLPFTFLTILIYRKIGFPPLFELLTAVVIVGIGLVTRNLIPREDLLVRNLVSYLLAHPGVVLSCIVAVAGIYYIKRVRGGKR